MPVLFRCQNDSISLRSLCLRCARRLWKFFIKLNYTRSLNQVNNPNTLVDDLLNMSRLEAGKLDFHRESFDLRKLLEEMAETFSYSNRSHQLLHDLGDKPVMIEGDR